MSVRIPNCELFLEFLTASRSLERISFSLAICVFWTMVDLTCSAALSTSFLQTRSLIQVLSAWCECILGIGVIRLEIDILAESVPLETLVVAGLDDPVEPLISLLLCIKPELISSTIKAEFTSSHPREDTIARWSGWRWPSRPPLRWGWRRGWWHGERHQRCPGRNSGGTEGTGRGIGGPNLSSSFYNLLLPLSEGFHLDSAGERVRFNTFKAPRTSVSFFAAVFLTMSFNNFTKSSRWEGEYKNNSNLRPSKE